MKIFFVIIFSFICLTSFAQKKKRINGSPALTIGLDLFKQKPRNRFADSLRWYRFTFSYGGRREKWGGGLFFKLSQASQSISPISNQRFKEMYVGWYFIRQQKIDRKWSYLLQLNTGGSFYFSNDFLGRNRQGSFSGVQVDLQPGFVFHLSRKIDVKLLSNGVGYFYRIDTEKDIVVSSLKLHNLLLLSQFELIYKFRTKRR